MKRSELTRRDFTRLTAAALGGFVAGGTLGCGRGERPADGPAAPGPAEGTEMDGSAPREPMGSEPREAQADDAGLTAEQERLLSEPHVCRGLNACKNLDATGENDCAGMGACATAAASECAGMNDCEGQGGCGTTAGRNACKNMGDCAVPLKPQAWENARKAFEEAMKAAGREFGPAPNGA